jgi:hypothetical protein
LSTIYLDHLYLPVHVVFEGLIFRHPQAVPRIPSFWCPLRVIARRRSYPPMPAGMSYRPRLKSFLCAVSGGLAIRYTPEVPKSSATAAASATRFICRVEVVARFGGFPAHSILWDRRDP